MVLVWLKCLVPTKISQFSVVEANSALDDLLRKELSSITSWIKLTDSPHISDKNMHLEVSYADVKHSPDRAKAVGGIC